MRKIIALLFIIPGHFLILVAALVYINSLNWHLDMLEEDVLVMKISGEKQS
jgi:hypothetical protein